MQPIVNRDHIAREEAYRLVWTRPLAVLAKKIGISGGDLAKRCRIAAVPVPGPGWWHRTRAGKPPPWRPLPKVLPEGAPTSVYWGPPLPDEIPPRVPTLDDIEEQRRLELMAIKITFPKDLKNLTPTAKRVAVECGLLAEPKKEALEKMYAAPGFNVEVQKSLAPRAVKIVETLIRAAAEMGWEYRAQKPEGNDSVWGRREHGNYRMLGYFDVEGERFTVRIYEGKKRTERPWRDKDRIAKLRGEYFVHPGYDFSPNGLMMMQINDGVNGNTICNAYKETKTKPLENKIPDALLEMLDTVLQRRRWRIEEEKAEQRREERAKQRALARARQEIQDRLKKQLETQLDNWVQASNLREYLSALKVARKGVPLIYKLGDQRINFIQWAETYIESIDPLTRLRR